MNSKRKFVVCGTAYWAEAVQLPGLKAMEDVELVGVYGRNEERLDELSEKFAIRSFTNFEEALDAVDGVSFSVPPMVQPDLAIKAAKAGKALLLEKPPARDRASAVALLEAIDMAGVSATCFLTRCYIPAVAAFMKHAGFALPEFTEAVLRTQGQSANSPYGKSEWRSDKLGALWDIGCHATTVQLQMAGPVIEVEASILADHTIEARFHHQNSSSRLEVNRRDVVTGRLERYKYRADNALLTLEVESYDAQAAYRRAASKLLAEMNNGGGKTTTFNLAFDIMSVLLAVEESIAHDGKTRMVVPLRS